MTAYATADTERWFVLLAIVAGLSISIGLFMFLDRLPEWLDRLADRLSPSQSAERSTDKGWGPGVPFTADRPDPAPTLPSSDSSAGAVRRQLEATAKQPCARAYFGAAAQLDGKPLDCLQQGISWRNACQPCLARLALEPDGAA